MAEKYISSKQAYGYLRIILYETATNNVGINDDFAAACEEIADNRLKIWLDEIPADDVVEWNVIHKRPMTEEERTEWSERLGYDVEYGDTFIYSNLPDDGEAVLVSSEWGNVSIDTFHQDQDDGCYFEENGDMDGIVAWMPLPKPMPREEKSNGTI